MNNINTITIVGGGTAGWMCAAYLSKHHRDKTVRVIESAHIGRIGVGEGSTPHLQQFMADLGVTESHWMRACDATYKAGIRFSHWNGDDSEYFHPFFSELDEKTAEVFFVNANARRRGAAVPAHPDGYFLAAQLAAQNRAPKALSALARPLHYGYHFDAQKLADWLRAYACARGVEHISGTVSQVQGRQRIEHVTLADGRTLQGDFYIDASGFQSLLVEKALQEPFIRFNDELLNDRAVAFATEALPNPPVYTHAQAMPSGWRWHIPLQSRCGNGYVYSSQYLSAEQAELQLRQALGEYHSSAKHLHMRVGMMRRALVSNVMAVGLAQSFIEPLEATALMITGHSITLLSQFIEGQVSAQHLNDELHTLVLGVKDYILGHYATSRRVDTPYWLASAGIAAQSPRIAPLLQRWRSGGDIDQWLHQHRHQQAYNRASWYCLLAGVDYRDTHLIQPFECAPAHIDSAAKAYVKTLCETHFGVHEQVLRL
ncbi:tryptophan 7-halogenase [Pseudoalteromonas ruthenica]|uniref:Tryptophan 7-halogenase n=1 Tax=Pseudoalteromonas ruthenica TaxID=151081 RepID=A0A5S3Z4R2_9GAMM|nr:tryptophan halogenase family protein [Pseudoalteromonas ruthenica]TMP86810.1 tryptophan 7-halogenase [Pseudoalteromonas ruthenica]